MEFKVIFASAVLACAPLAVAGGNAAYPSTNVAAFIVEKLDVTSLPSMFRPKKEKGKKTLADYGFTTQKVEENEAVVLAHDGAMQLSFKVLDQGDSGIYACFTVPGQIDSDAKVQSAVLLKRKDPNALLKGHASSRKFASCPIIGGSDSAESAY